MELRQLQKCARLCSCGGSQKIVRTSSRELPLNLMFNAAFAVGSQQVLMAAVYEESPMATLTNHQSSMYKFILLVQICTDRLND